ncbi:MAG: NAD(P)H-hydrate epimerase [Anaerolineae bacterium]|nr:NAD(P)H-hydrate epimerase [Anaerolineae bacterium]
MVFFDTQEGLRIPAVTAAEMREVDRIAVEEFGLGILQMMENAGRNLAENALVMLGKSDCEIVVLAGAGGNGGGGLCCARHLHNRGCTVKVVLDHAPDQLKGPAAVQWHILQTAGVECVPSGMVDRALERAGLIIDALIGYSLRGTPQGYTAELISLCNAKSIPVLALDLPSGLNATTGESPGVVIRANRILTLALPKTGLRNIPGALYLADIGIPPEVYRQVGIDVPVLFSKRYWIQLQTA